jgi:hypothetical protein
VNTEGVDARDAGLRLTVVDRHGDRLGAARVALPVAGERDDRVLAVGDGRRVPGELVDVALVRAVRPLDALAVDLEAHAVQDPLS